MKATNGQEIKAGDLITTWGAKAVYEVVDVGGELYLKGVKPLRQVNCTPFIVARVFNLHTMDAQKELSELKRLLNIDIEKWETKADEYEYAAKFTEETHAISLRSKAKIMRLCANQLKKL